MQSIYEFAQNIKGISVHDCFALFHAESQGIPLLTGDGNLRKIARSRGIDVRGTIWIVEQFLVDEILTQRQAISAVQKMKESADCRLPWPIFDEMLARYI